MTEAGLTTSGYSDPDTRADDDDEDDLIPVPVYGLPGYRFTLIHVTALVSLTISLIFSSSVLVYLNQQNKQFYQRPIGDRLVIYLAICDLLFSVSHIMDHSFMFAIKGHPPDGPCAAFAFLLNQFIVGQALIVIFTAINAFSMIVLRKLVPIGRYDWRLIVYSMGLPAIFGILGVSTNHFGPSGTWCYIDMRRPLGQMLNNLVAAIMILTFIFNVVCYLGIWLKIRQVAKTQQQTLKYSRTAKVMMLFVAAYIGQWWAYVAQATWGFFGYPHVSIFWAAVFFSNMGGVFNFFAYTFIRRKYQSVGEKAPNPASTTCATSG